jgi:trk system potassium uptake protein
LASQKIPKGDSVVVIGLGRFGGAVAESLVALGHDVLGVDASEALVQTWAERLTHVVQADSSARRSSITRWWASAPISKPAC